MMNRKNSFQLSPRLKLGVGRHIPKIGIIKIFIGAFIVFSVGLGVNAYKLYTNVSGKETQGNGPQVLGISDTKAANDESSEQISITTYVVKKGDTLFSIAQQFNISWTTLATINAINSPFTVTPGQELKVPKQ